MLKDSSNPILKEKIYIALLTGIQFFNILDFVVLMPLGPTLMRYFSITPLQFSALASSYSISAGVTGVLYSAFADKYNRKKFLLLILAGFTLMTFFCSVAPNFEVLLIARILTGVFGGIITPIVYAIIAELIPFERRGRAMGTVMASFSITSILGIPTGLLIADFFSWRHTFYFITFGAFLIILVTRIILPSLPVTKIMHTPKEIVLNLWRVSIKKEYQLPFWIMFLYTFSGFMLFPFLSPYAVKNIGLAEADLKYIYLVGGIFTVFFSRYSGVLTDRLGSLKVFIPALLISMPFIYLYTSVGQMSLAGLLIISTGFMIMINFRFVPVMTLITETPKDSERGAFMGILISLRSFAMAAGTSFTGLVVIENSQGQLERFNYVGILSILTSFIGMFLVIKLYKVIMVRKTNGHQPT